MLWRGEEMEQKALDSAVSEILVAARTAPKAKGIDNLVTAVATDGTIEKLRNHMENLAEKTGAQFLKRDAENLKNTPYVILLGTKINPVNVPYCGYCGYKDCQENRANDGICAFNTGDLGIALGSAVSKAADLRIDNRIMFSAGKAASELSLLGDDVSIIYALPLYIGGKNIYFDR